MKQVPFIAIEGPIGIGKTSLAKKLSTYFNYHLLKEIVEENPFLDDFYNSKGTEDWNFQTEMFFLCNRYKQIGEIKKHYLMNNKPVIADYHIFKSMLFARQTITGEELKKYEQIFHILVDDLPIPNIIIYLRADLHTIMGRIRKRAREIETDISESYIKQISYAYENFMNEFELLHPHIPVIRIDAGNLDFVTNQADLDFIINKIKTYLLVENSPKGK